jgi:hypothetical protein
MSIAPVVKITHVDNRRAVSRALIKAGPDVLMTSASPPNSAAVAIVSAANPHDGGVEPIFRIQADTL